MSFRRLFEDTSCPRFGDEPRDPPPVTINAEPVTNNSPPVTRKRGRPASLSIEERKANAAAKVVEWRRRKKAP